jgi:hypothetical protein
MRLSTAEITKTLSGVRLLTNKRRACRPATDGYGARFDCAETEDRPVACAPAGILPAVLQTGWQRSKTPLGAQTWKSVFPHDVAPQRVALPQIVARVFQFQ